MLLVEKLAGASDSIFHGALGQLPAINNISGTDGVHLIENVVKRLIALNELGERAQADRVHAILRRIGLVENALSELAYKSRDFPPGVRNSIAGFLPPIQRRLLLRPYDGNQIRKPLEPLEPLEPLAREPTFATADSAQGQPLSSVPDDSRFSTVVLLAGPFQDANKQLLSVRGFGPLVWTSLDNLDQDLTRNADVCACLVDGTVLQELDREAQKELFRLLGEYSTFIWIRVEDRHLKLSHAEIRDCLRIARCLREEVPAALLSIQAEATLREREVDDIDFASKALHAGHDAQFIPGELTVDQARLLMAAAKLHARELQIEGQVELKSLETRFMPGGRSGAQIAILRVNRDGYPIVAKIDRKESVLGEMQRFRTFIEPWDNELRPKLHFHGEAAVLLFGLIQDARSPLEPAVDLASRLESLWNDQLFAARPTEVQMQMRNALAEGVENTARKLGELNSRKPPASELPPRGNPEVGALEKLAETGIDWGLSDIARTALSKAKERFRRLELAATIHGDVHLKNILLRDDRYPHLIDYAGSGPGHPSVDLVRLELALLLDPLRQIESEDKCVEYQRAFTFDCAPYADLEKRFERLHRCHLNVVCLRGCIAARDQARDVLRVYGGDNFDYQAAKYLVAWQNLVMMGRHTGLARATIIALAPEIARW